jgi:hypothetical protein
LERQWKRKIALRGRKENEMSTNKERDLTYINLQKSKEELKDLVSLYDVNAETLSEVYNVNYGFGKEYIWDRLCENAPGLQKANLRDEKTFLSLLAAIHTAKAQKKRGVGARKENKQPERHVDIAHDLLADYSFKTMRDTEEVLFYNKSD